MEEKRFRDLRLRPRSFHYTETEKFDSLQLFHNPNKIFGRSPENQTHMHESFLLQSGPGLLQNLVSLA